MKTVLITGASRGIGKACAQAFYEKGYRVVINYHTSKTAAQELAGALGDRALALQADVSDEKQVQAMFRQVRNVFGPVDVLVNNAGICFKGMLADTPAEDWNRMLGVNLTGSFFCTRCALEDMLYAGGAIINISSVFGESGGSCEAAYSASKAGLIGLTKALAKETPRVRVNCVSPGAVETDMNAYLSPGERQELIGEIPAGRLGRAEEIAAAVLFLAEQGYITGQVLAVNGGLHI